MAVALAVTDELVLPFHAVWDLAAAAGFFWARHPSSSPLVSRGGGGGLWPDLLRHGEPEYHGGLNLQHNIEYRPRRSLSTTAGSPPLQGRAARAGARDAERARGPIHARQVHRP